MALTVLLGGARSGKSAAAQSMAEAFKKPVTYVATATAGDDEMSERIARHRSERATAWTTIEEPIQVGDTLRGIAVGNTVIIDCLTLWLTNMMGQGEDEANILRTAEAASLIAAGREGETIAVSNEVGLGLVPPNPLGRQFRDLAGRVNRVWVNHSSRTGFVVAGRILPLVELSDWKDTNDDH